MEHSYKSRNRNVFPQLQEHLLKQLLAPCGENEGWQLPKQVFVKLENNRIETSWKTAEKMGCTY